MCCNWPRARPPHDADRYAAKLLAMVLGDDSGSRLYWELVDSGLAEHAEMSHYEYEGAGVFITYMSCAPEETAENLRRIAEVYRRAQADGDHRRPSWSRRRARSVRGWSFPASGRAAGCSPSAAIGSIAANIAPVEQDLAEIAAITIDDAAAVLRKYPLERNMTISVGPAEGG